MKYLIGITFKPADEQNASVMRKPQKKRAKALNVEVVEGSFRVQQVLNRFGKKSGNYNKE